VSQITSVDNRKHGRGDDLALCHLKSAKKGAKSVGLGGGRFSPQNVGQF
jgi:hypothetical protein